MSSSGDNFIYNSASASGLKFAGSYNDKQWYWQGDAQNGNVGNQVTFNLNSFFSESDKFVSLSEGYIVLPMIGVVHKEGGPSFLTKNDFAMGLKNSYLNLINSMTLEIDGKSKVQNSQYINIPLIFKQVTSASLEDMESNANGFFLDSSDSWHFNYGSSPLAANRTAAQPFNSTDSACGNGIINNVLSESLNTTSAFNVGSRNNSGFLRRVMNENFSPNLTSGSTLSVWANNAGQIRSLTSVQNELKSYTVVSETGNDLAYQAFYYCCIVKLKDLCDVFSENAMSLCKAVNINLTLQLNTGNCTITQTHGAAADNLFKNCMLGAGESSFNYTCPIMAAPQTYSDFGTTTTSRLTYGLYCQSVKNLGGNSQVKLNVQPHILPQCRIYLPIVSLKPSLASLYLQNNQAKLIKYTDIYSSVLPNVQAGGLVNYTVSNGIVGARQLLVFPVISGSVNGYINSVAVVPAGLRTTAAAFSPLISPFTSEPATTSPLIQLADFGVTMGGKEVLQSKVTYSFEHFIENFYETGKVNGGLGKPVFNGLIGKNDWENNYRYYVVDLSRGMEEDDQTPRDIRLTARNDNLVPIDLYCFVFQTKKFVVNVGTGKISDNVVSASSLE